MSNTVPRDWTLKWGRARTSHERLYSRAQKTFTENYNLEFNLSRFEAHILYSIRVLQRIAIGTRWRKLKKKKFLHHSITGNSYLSPRHSVIRNRSDFASTLRAHTNRKPSLKHWNCNRPMKIMKNLSCAIDITVQTFHPSHCARSDRFDNNIYNFFCWTDHTMISGSN